MITVSAPSHADLYHRVGLPGPGGGDERLQLVATFKVAYPDVGRSLVAEIRRMSSGPKWHERLGPSAILQQGPFRASAPGDAVVLQGAGEPEAFLLEASGCAPTSFASVEAMADTGGVYVVEKVSGLKEAGHVASSYVVAGDGTIRAYNGLFAAKQLAEQLNAAGDDNSFHRPMPQPEW